MALGFWTPERFFVLQKLAADGLSASEIGERLGCSRNAVIGRCNRHGISLPRTERKAKKSGKRGEAHHFAKLTSGDVRAIRQLRAEGVMIKVLAARFGVGHSAISNAALGRNWSHITDAEPVE